MWPSRLLVIAFVGLSGCIQSSAVRCGELTCAANAVCSPAGDACTTQQQIDICRDVEELGSCVAPGERAGVCRDGYCQEVRCGDLRIDPGEMCDDGNTNAGDGCSSDCGSDETCGNSVVDRGSEECDDGDVESRDGCSMTCRTESPIWRESVDTSFHPRQGHAMAYDSARKRVVLFGGRGPSALSNETWEFDGEMWALRMPASSPSRREGASLAYDPVAQRVILFGGVGDNDTWFADTWEWDGTTWTEKSPATAPSARAGAGMAYHPGRARVVLHGGDEGAVVSSETWEYDGSTWTKMPFSAGSPGKAALHTLTYDPSVDAIVTVTVGVSQALEVWKYTGTWSSVTMTGSLPRSRLAYSMAFDASGGHTVLVGGSGAQCGFTTNCNDAFELIYDGSSGTVQWSGFGLPHAPSRGAMAYDADTSQLVLMGGMTPGASQPSQATWIREGITWSLLEVPPSRAGCQLAYLPALGGSVLFGGQTATAQTNLDDTWLLRDGRWIRLRPASAPGATAYASMVLDRGRNRLVLFDTQSRTWEFDGASWSEVVTTAAPLQRQEFQLAYDDVRGAVVLFGGYDPIAKQSLADTWTYDGTSWTELSTSASPSARHAHALSYDGARGVVVLFGGTGSDTTTWELSGTTWSATTSTGAPMRSGAGLVYDSRRASLVLFSGRGASNTPLDDTWEYAGGAWRQAGTVGPPPRTSYCATYDETLEKVVVVGGTPAGAALRDTWLFGYE